MTSLGGHNLPKAAKHTVIAILNTQNNIAYSHWISVN